MTEEHVIDIPDDYESRIVDHKRIIRMFDLMQSSLKFLKLRDEKT
jgi:hypothetical protein